jgi:predicted permease
MGLYILLIVVIYSKAISTFEKIVSGKYKTMNRQIDSKKSQVIVKTKSPIKAFLRKDLIIASRSLKTFMSIIAPILFSFIFVFYYNLSYTGGEQIINWAVILGFSLITSGIIVHNITNIDISGKTIMTTLPIIPRDQAIAKLILIISVQTVSTVSPSLMYIFHSNFFNILEMLSGLLPLVYIFLLLIFLMKIKLFSKVRNHYVVEEISSDNKFFNWLKILILTYIIYFIIILVAFFVFYTQELQTFLLIISLISLISLFFLTLYFKSLFPKPRN